MKITKQELIELEACKGGLDRFIAQTGNTDEPVEVSSLIGGENNYTDLLWLAAKKFPKKRIVRFACDCALLNIELIKPYTDKYDMIVEFLRNPNITNPFARGAAWDIYTAASAAYSAADHAITYSAADAIRAAATSAAFTAFSAAASAANSAEDAAGNKEKVEELLKELFA